MCSYIRIDRFGIKPSICEKSPRKPACGIEVGDDDNGENDEAQEISRMNVNTAQNFMQNQGTPASYFQGLID